MFRSLAAERDKDRVGVELEQNTKSFEGKICRRIRPNTPGSWNRCEWEGGSEGDDGIYLESTRQQEERNGEGLARGCWRALALAWALAMQARGRVHRHRADLFFFFFFFPFLPTKIS